MHVKDRAAFEEYLQRARMTTKHMNRDQFISKTWDRITFELLDSATRA